MNYESPKMELVEMDVDDVIVASQCSGDTGEFDLVGLGTGC